MNICLVICHNLDENNLIYHDKIENILILLWLSSFCVENVWKWKEIKIIDLTVDNNG